MYRTGSDHWEAAPCAKRKSRTGNCLCTSQGVLYPPQRVRAGAAQALCTCDGSAQTKQQTIHGTTPGHHQQPTYCAQAAGRPTSKNCPAANCQAMLACRPAPQCNNGALCIRGVYRNSTAPGSNGSSSSAPVIHSMTWPLVKSTHASASQPARCPVYSQVLQPQPKPRTMTTSQG